MCKHKRYKRKAKRAIGHCIKTNKECNTCNLIKKCVDLTGFYYPYEYGIREMRKRLKGIGSEQ